MTTDTQETTTTQPEVGQGQRAAALKARRLIWLIFGILEVVVGLRVVFKLIGVNAENAFAAFLYSVTGIFAAPFATLARAPAAAGMVLEISSIIAMILYLLIAWALERIVYVLFCRPRGPVTVNQTTAARSIPLQEPTSVTRMPAVGHIPLKAPSSETDASTASHTPLRAPQTHSQAAVSPSTNPRTPGAV